MKVTIPKLIKYSIADIGNKTFQKSALKIYAALYDRSKRKNSEGYFDVPSTYLKAINVRYYKVIDKFIEDGILDYFKREVQDDKDIFTTHIRKYYNKNLGICMKYKFLIDIEKGEEMEVDMESNRNERWYKITHNTLTNLGYKDIKISRDSFGRRVHHNLTQTYKYELADRGLSVIDAKCSQPRLLYRMMKNRGIVDETYNHIFENGIDFYNFLIERLNESDRKSAKDLFMYWLNSDGYVPNYNINKLFPEASKFIKSLKSKDHKNSASTLQREEAKIWIDELLENLPVEFGLSIHDSLIVKDKDAIKILKYCKDKYPDLEFDVKEL
jgi:hypothetical protein